MRLWKVLAALVILVVAGLTGYAYLGDLTPDRREVRVPIALGPDGLVVGRAASAAPGLDGTDPAPDDGAGDEAAGDDDAGNDSAGNDAPD